MRIHAIVLAAGLSTRFGDDKLAKLYKGQTVLNYLLNRLKELPFEEVYVVTNEKTYKLIDERLKFNILINKDAQQGISTSIRLGLQLSSECEAYCFIVADQLALKKETIADMLNTYKDNQTGILCASHRGELGNPVIFSNCYKEELMQLKGDVGGKKVLKKHLADVTLFEVSDKNELIDIDTKLDWNRLLMEEKSWNN